MGLLERLKAKLDERKASDAERYRELVRRHADLDDAALGELYEVMMRLGKTPEEVEADARVYEEAAALEARASKAGELEAAAKKAREHYAAEWRRHEAVVEESEEKVNEARWDWEQANKAWRDAAGAQDRLVALRAEHPELFGVEKTSKGEGE